MAVVANCFKVMAALRCLDKQWQHASRASNLAVCLPRTSRKGMYHRFAGLFLWCGTRGGGSFYVVFRGRGRCQYGLTALENGRIQPLGLGCASKCNASPMASYRWATSHRNTPTTTSNAEGPAVATSTTTILTQSTPTRVCSAPFSGKVSPERCF